MEQKSELNNIIIGLLIFVLIVILMETHNYYTGKYDLLERDDEKDYSKDKDVKQNINVIRRKNTVIIKD
jgi:hypothetical protein